MPVNVGCWGDFVTRITVYWVAAFEQQNEGVLSKKLSSEVGFRDAELKQPKQTEVG